MNDKSKSAALGRMGCLGLVLGAVFVLAPFVVMTGSNLRGADGYIFGGCLVFGVCLGIAGIIMLVRAAMVKRR